MRLSFLSRFSSFPSVRQTGVTSEMLGKFSSEDRGGVAFTVDATGALLKCLVFMWITILRCNV